MSERVKGSNPHGFTNEILIVQALNNQKLKNLNPNMKKFIRDICSDKKISISDNTVIESRIEKSNKLKQDFYITIKGNELGISTKMGTGNSVHQEKIEEFIEWISKKSKVNVTNEIKDALRFFIWADGSVDGKAPIVTGKDGKIKGRFGASEFKDLYPEKRKLIQEFLQSNERDIIDRVIFKGKNNSSVDYVYHGTPFNGVWLAKDEIIDFNIKNTKLNDSKNSAAIVVGRLSVQPWNSCLKKDNPKKRGQIQFKYSSMIKDFENLMLMKASNIGTFEGDREEFNISKFMNKNKGHKFWDVLSEKCNLSENRENYYIVKVDGNKESLLTNKKVKCKSDDFIIKAQLDENYLLQCEYQITESMLKNIGEYEIINNSGISVKRADSERYTIIKFTKNTFKKAFETYIDEIDYIIAGLLLYSDKKKIFSNSKIIDDLNINEEKLKTFYFKEYNIEGKGILDVDFVQEISAKAKDIVKQVIEENENLKVSIFTGKGWFENPYYINFIFKHGVLSTDIYSSYTISNGSGRSKGHYTIILKPQ